jgi:hypothetical protein
MRTRFKKWLRNGYIFGTVVLVLGPILTSVLLTLAEYSKWSAYFLGLLDGVFLTIGILTILVEYLSRKEQLTIESNRSV